MIEAFTAAAVREAELGLLARERGFSGGLMHRAAWALAASVRRLLTADGLRVQGSTVVALVGTGNNGGDALHALALLARHGVRVVAVAAGPVHHGGLEALTACGGRVLAVGPEAPGDVVWLGEAVAEAFAADVVLDGLLGIGARGGMRGTPARLVELLGGLLDSVGEGSGPRVVAVDVPSGIGVDDGSVPGPVLAADRTVTFGAVKAGLLLPPAALLTGEVELVDLGLGAPLAERGSMAVVHRLTATDVAASWPVPTALSHKYSRGVVGVVAGSSGYPGAAVLTVAGAIGAGAGMVRYLGPRRVADAVLAAHPEVVVGDGRVQAWVVGPGVVGARQSGLVREVLAGALADGTPVVVDAGALALLPERLGPLTVLTPHAGELAALLVGLGVDVDRGAVEAEPLRWARIAHHLTGATVLLKGATTLVVGADVALSQADATPWLATAGAGDVLAGVLGALLAGLAAAGQGAVPVAEAAAAAALVHGTAARRANPGGPVSASVVAAEVPRVVAGLLGA